MKNYECRYKTPFGDGLQFVSAENKQEAKEKFIRKYGKYKGLKIKLSESQ